MARNPAVKTGPALQNEILRTRVKRGQVAIWWLGQATFCLKFGDAIVYTDPFYRAEDQDPPTLQVLPLKPHEFANASLICCTHEHLDHIDPLTLPGAAAASPTAGVVFPKAATKLVKSLRIPVRQRLPMRGDDTLRRAGVTVRAIPAAHMTLDWTKKDGYRWLGYVFQGNGVTLYHTGDLQPYEGWYERVARFNLDVALLPISARDNLHYTQAIYFCANHRPRLAIPMHFGLFKDWTEDPRKFVEGLARNVPRQRTRVLRVGERFIYSRK